jgi:hypothetical protein
MHGREAMSVRATLDRRLVRSAYLALQGPIARWMTIHTSRVRQHLPQFGEQRSRSRRSIGNRDEALRIGKLVRVAGRERQVRENAYKKRKPHLFARAG